MVAFEIGKESKHYCWHMWKFAFSFTVAGLKNRLDTMNTKSNRKHVGNKQSNTVYLSFMFIFTKCKRNNLWHRTGEIQVQGAFLNTSLLCSTLNVILLWYKCQHGRLTYKCGTFKCTHTWSDPLARKKEVWLTASVGCPSSHDPGHEDGSCLFVTPYRCPLQSNQRIKAAQNYS